MFTENQRLFIVLYIIIEYDFKKKSEPLDQGTPCKSVFSCVFTKSYNIFDSHTHKKVKSPKKTCPALLRNCKRCPPRSKKQPVSMGFSACAQKDHVEKSIIQITYCLELISIDKQKNSFALSVSPY